MLPTFLVGRWEVSGMLLKGYHTYENLLEMDDEPYYLWYSKERLWCNEDIERWEVYFLNNTQNHV